MKINEVVNDILKEIITEIKEVPKDKFYKHEDDWYRSGIDEGVGRAIEIIEKYFNCTIYRIEPLPEDTTLTPAEEDVFEMLSKQSK